MKADTKEHYKQKTRAKTTSETDAQINCHAVYQFKTCFFSLLKTCEKKQKLQLENQCKSLFIFLIPAVHPNSKQAQFIPKYFVHFTILLVFSPCVIKSRAVSAFLVLSQTYLQCTLDSTKAAP